MINIVAIASLRDLPQMATYGLGSIFFYVLAGVLFFFPVSLVAAELASGWPERGGVYVWVREAFGERAGFVAVFIQWFQNVCWYPVVLTFAASSFAFFLFEDRAVAFANDKVYVVSFVLVVYWGATFWNFLGMKSSAVVSVIGAVCGVLVPGVVLIGSGAAYLWSGRASHLFENGADLVPDMRSMRNITFAVSVLLAFAGMEMTAAHAREVRRPTRTYPLSIFIAAVVIITVFILGALSIAVALRPDQYELQTGVTEAIKIMLRDFRVRYVARLVALMMAIGVVGSVNSWIVGPSKGLLAAGESSGALPGPLIKTNSRGVPRIILITQAVLTSFLCLAFTLQPTVASAYFMLSDLTIQLYLIMYVMMFAAAIRLRHTHPETKRPFKLPFGQTGMWVVAGLGVLAAVACVIIGFSPPSQFTGETMHSTLFIVFLAIGCVVTCAIPVTIFSLKEKWRR